MGVIFLVCTFRLGVGTTTQHASGFHPKIVKGRKVNVPHQLTYVYLNYIFMAFMVDVGICKTEIEEVVHKSY